MIRLNWTVSSFGELLHTLGLDEGNKLPNTGGAIDVNMEFSSIGTMLSELSRPAGLIPDSEPPEPKPKRTRRKKKPDNEPAAEGTEVSESKEANDGPTATVTDDGKTDGATSPATEGLPEKDQIRSVRVALVAASDRAGQETVLKFLKENYNTNTAAGIPADKRAEVLEQVALLGADNA